MGGNYSYQGENTFMDPREAIKMYLFGDSLSEVVKETSCFIAALRDARKATCRQINGDTLPDINHGSWLGAIGYMVLLDQIGGCLKPKNRQSKYKNGFKKALDYFESGLNDDDINALYALRCSFAHDYSLINIDKNFKGIDKSKDKLTHCFHVGGGKASKVVELPKERWERDFKNISDDEITYINLEALGDIVEKICSKIIDKFHRDELELSVPVEQFLKRYFFHTQINP
jgi:hypothetical protein